MTEFSDISDDDFLLSATQVIESSNGRKSESDLLKEINEKEKWRPFREPISEEQLEGLQANRFPKGTVDQSLWAVTIFGEWRAQRNLRCLQDESSGLVYINKPFSEMDHSEMAYSVPVFLAEVLKKDGKEYPPSTLKQMVIALQKHLEVKCGQVVRFLHDDQFKAIQNTLDAIMKRGTREGLGISKRQADVISEAMEDGLWNKCLLRSGSPQLLLNTMVYLLGLHFALRGRDKHRRLPQISCL
jgi:hypothetical protein